MDTAKITSFGNVALEQIKMYAPKLAIALLALIIGFWLIKKMMKLVDISLSRYTSPEVKPYLTSIISVLLKVLMLLIVAGIIGIETSSFVAIFAAAGFAIGMALQGSLGNFAAGVLILIFKPYKVGDIIEVNGAKGHVREIQIFNTIIEKVTNETVIIPNGLAINDNVINYSTKGNLRVDVFAHIPYEEDFDKVQKILLDAVKEHPLVLETPATAVGIEEFDSHNIKIGVFTYTKPDDYWTVYYDTTNLVKTTLGKNGIKVAYSEGIELGKIGEN